MRPQLLLCLAATSFGACNWGDFDDLADETWVHTTEKPSVGSTDYAVAFVGTSMSSSGGQLAVIGNDSPTYSTLDFTADGESSVGPNQQRLSSHFIAVLSDPPLFISDGNGKIALVERAIDAGNIAVVVGPSTAPADTPFAATAAPDAAAFAGANVIVAAAANVYTVTGTGAPTTCAVDPIGGSPFSAAALASDGTTLYAWTKAGVFVGYPIASLAPCNGGTVPAPGSNTFTTTGFMPGPGARIHLVGNYAILTAKATNSRQGQVFVVDLTSVAQVGATLNVEGLRSSVVAVFGTTTYLVVGVPDRSVGGVVAGQVDVFEFAPATGALGATPVVQLNDAQPESGANYGRVLSTMKFNDKTILVVGGSNEVLAYYKTSLYDALP